MFFLENFLSEIFSMTFFLGNFFPRHFFWDIFSRVSVNAHSSASFLYTDSWFLSFISLSFFQIFSIPNSNFALFFLVDVVFSWFFLRVLFLELFTVRLFFAFFFRVSVFLSFLLRVLGLAVFYDVFLFIFG